jgi:DNA-binding NarL/FixJ family response regulator
VPTVLLCDDAVAFSILFRRWMAEGDIEVVGHAKTAVEAVALAGDLHPEVIVVDHLLPDGSSADLVPRLREASPAGRFLLISSMPVRDLEQAAQDAAVDGHLSKAASGEEMCAAIRAVLG